MTATLPPDVVGYRNGDNTALRWALFQVWKQCCYSCREPKVFGEIEIDHIIPRDTDAGRLRELIAEHGLGADFHIDRPGNLAPACRKCNGRKSNRDLLHALVTTNLLAQAKDRAAEVERRFRAYHSANNVARGLIEAAKANPYDPEIRADYLEFAPAIVRTLAQIDENKAGDFICMRQLEVNGQEVVLVVDPRGRFAFNVITTICGGSVESVIEQVVRDATTLLDKHADEHVRQIWDEPTLAVAKTYVLHMHVTDVHRNGPTITIGFLGGLLREFGVAVTVTGPDGVPRDVVEPPHDELRVGITFDWTAQWDLSATPGTPPAVTIGSAEYDVA